MSFFGVKTKPTGPLRTVDYDDNDDFDDGLANALDEANDDFNDETFGTDISSLKQQKDFDFAGQTAQHVPQIDHGQVAWEYHRPPSQSSPQTLSRQNQQPQQQQPLQRQQYVPKLQPIASLWGDQPDQSTSTAGVGAGSAPSGQRKFLSVEEVEAEMLRSSGGQHGVPPQHMYAQQQQQQQQPQHMMPGHMPPHPQMMHMDPWASGSASSFPGMQGMRMPMQGYPGMGLPHHPPPGGNAGAPGGGFGMNMPIGSMGGFGGPQGPQPVSGPAPPGFAGVERHPENVSQEQQQQQEPLPQQPQSVPPQPQQHPEPIPLDQLMAEDQRAHEAENAKDSELTKKLNQMEKLNGLMSQWDKNFIMRIQLQQMVSKDQYNDDFYYQVHSAIEAQRNPHQPVNALAKTYMLLNRGRKNRRHNDNPLQKMQQQVKDAVEAARDHPKREQITVEGALGRLQVSSGSRPRRALNLHAKGASDVSEGDLASVGGEEGETAATKAASSSRTNAASTLSALNSRAGRKTGILKQDTLQSLEDIYAVLLEIESIERSATPDEGKIKELLERLWDLVQVQEHGESKETQPFILMLAHDKGKKLIPRLFRHLDSTQRLTVLTRIVAHIDCLDVIKNGSYVTANGTTDITAVNAKSRESIELFTQTVLPPLVQLISDSSFDVVIGLLDIMIQNQHILPAAFTKVGLAILTVLISRAELLNQEGSVSGADSESWKYCFETLFSRVRGHMASLFPPRTVEDSYVWHFLAALALAAKLDSQRVIVDEVRDKIFGTMAEAKALPPELGVAKISNLNLFLNVMGLNATTTEITELKE